MDITQKTVILSTMRAVVQDGFTSWFFGDKSGVTNWIIAGSSIGYSSIGMIKTHVVDYSPSAFLPYVAAGVGGGVKYLIIKHDLSVIHYNDLMIASSTQILLEAFKEYGMAKDMFGSVLSMTSVQMFSKMCFAHTHEQNMGGAFFEALYHGISKGMAMGMVTKLTPYLFPAETAEHTELRVQESCNLQDGHVSYGDFYKNQDYPID